MTIAARLLQGRKRIYSGQQGLFAAQPMSLRYSAAQKFSFVAPLRTNVFLERGAGAFSFTRATTATVEDWEGAIRVCKSGEVRFPGARRVENLLANSAWIGSGTPYLPSGGWAYASSTGTTSVADSTRGDGHKALTFSANVGRQVLFPAIVAVAAGETYILSVNVVANTGLEFIQVLSTGGSTATFSSTTWLENNTTGAGAAPVGRIALRVVVQAAGNLIMRVGAGCAGNATGSVTLEAPMLERVTGQSNQNPSEYVSVGAERANRIINTEELNAPSWTLTRAAIARTATLAPDGTPTAWALTEDSTAANNHLWRATSVTTTVGEYVVFAILAKKDTRQNIVFADYGVAATEVTFDLDAGAVTTVSGSVFASGIIPDADGWYLCYAAWLKGAATASPAVLLHNGTSIVYNGDGASGVFLCRPRLHVGTYPNDYFPVGNVYPFHGACVDGVKYFDTENGNTVTNNVVTEATGATLTTCKGQLDETASTNLVLQSSNFGTTWANVFTPTLSEAAKYCGGIALDLLGDDDAANAEAKTQPITFTADADKSVSFLIAQGTGAGQHVRLRDDTVPVNRLWGCVTWSGGVPTLTCSAGSQERPPEPKGGGVWRIFARASGVVAANTNTLYFYPSAGTTAGSINGAATGTAYIGGVQAENATTASSHIPTTTGTVTRNADAGSYPAAGNVSASGGTLYLEYEIERDTGADQLLAEIGDGSSNERISFYRGAAGNLTVYTSDGGAAQCALNLGAAAVGSAGKIAVRWAANDFAGVMTGGAIQTDASGTLPTVTAIFPGNGRGTAYQAQGPIKNLRIAQTALSNQELVALTA